MASNNPPNFFDAGDEEEDDDEDEDYDPSVDSDEAGTESDLESNGAAAQLHQVVTVSMTDAVAYALEAAPRASVTLEAAADSAQVVVDVDEGDELGDERNDDDDEEEEEEEEEEDDGGCGGGESEGCVTANVDELDRSFFPNCPVCMEMWRSEGRHRICCIPCGHVYGRSCLEKWLDRCGRIGKCPQCNKEYMRKEIINLYAPQISVPNDDLEKELHCLREKNECLQSEKAQLLEELNKYKKHARDMEFYVMPKMPCVEHASSGGTWRPFDYYDDSARSSFGSSLESQSLSGNGIRGCSFVLQNELMVNGARVMAIDASSQIVIVSGKSPAVEREHILSKISLLSPSEADKIPLPADTRATKDLCVLPNRLALLASLGKKLLLLSTDSNNIVLKYDLPAPAWSCSGDHNSPYHIYAGLQSGTLLVFDIRQTAESICALEGLTRQPIHTVHSLVPSYESKKVLTGSSVGPCLWEIDSNGARPSLIPGVGNQGVCISLASSSSVPDVVASFRPKVEFLHDNISSQASLSPSSAISGSGKLGCHVLLKRVDRFAYQRHDAVGYSSVSEHRMAKSATFSTDQNTPLFAIGDESARRVRVWELPTFQEYTDLKPHKNPILDLQYERASSGPGFLGCISEDTLQVYRQYSRC